MNDRRYLVTVIIPTYGTPAYLKKSIQSVINQTLKEWELIIVDDNDPDSDARKKTEELVAYFLETDERIKYIKHPRNMNGAVARNTGFKDAKGIFISLLDSDDEYMPKRLQRCYDALISAPDTVAGVYTGCEFRRHGKKYHAEKYVPSGNFLVDTLACRFMFCTGSNIFVRKSVVEELHGFDPAFLRHQDYEFLVRVFEKYSLIGLSEVLVIKNNENFNMPNINKLIEIKEQYLVKYSYIIDKLPQSDVSYINSCKCIDLAEGAMANSEFKLVNQYYKEARKYGPIPLRTWIRRFAYPIYNLIR